MVAISVTRNVVRVQTSLISAMFGDLLEEREIKKSLGLPSRIFVSYVAGNRKGAPKFKFDLCFLPQAIMYIAGLRYMVPSQQGIEGLATLITADSFRYLLWKLRTQETTEERSGIQIPELPSRSFLETFVFPIQGVAALAPPAIYCIAVAFNNFHQPAWMLKLALPDDIIQPEWKAPLRLVACVAGFSLKFLLDQIPGYSDSGWRMIGRCEKPKITRLGPYSVVRHPVYSVMLLQQAIFSVMYWSYIPLASLGVLAGVFAMKMPLEEKAAQEDDIIRDDYTEYMKRTPAKIIPYVW